jgi:hypothetical protein
LPEPAPPRVFISYSHDSETHADQVLALAERLLAEGVDASIDQYIQSPPEGWPAWCEAEIRKADFVLMVCTETYLRRVNREEEAGKGHGALWEARLIRQYLYDSGSVSSKFVPSCSPMACTTTSRHRSRAAVFIVSSQTKDTRAYIAY